MIQAESAFRTAAVPRLAAPIRPHSPLTSTPASASGVFPKGRSRLGPCESSQMQTPAHPTQEGKGCSEVTEGAEENPEGCHAGLLGRCSAVHPSCFSVFSEQAIHTDGSV